MVLCIQSTKCSEFANNMLQNLHHCIPDHFRPLSTLMWSKNTFIRPWISLPSFLSTLYWDKTPWTGRSRLWTVVSCLVLCHGLWTRQTARWQKADMRQSIYNIIPDLSNFVGTQVEWKCWICLYIFLVICMFYAIKNVEYQMSLPSDDERACMLYGSLAKEGHPMGKFFTGNVMSVQPNTIDVCIVIVTFVAFLIFFLIYMVTFNVNIQKIHLCISG